MVQLQVLVLAVPRTRARVLHFVLMNTEYMLDILNLIYLLKLPLSNGKLAPH